MILTRIILALVAFFPALSFGGIKEIQSLKNAQGKFELVCLNGSSETRSDSELRRDDVCGGPELSVIEEEEHYRRYDFGGECTANDQRWALDRVKFELNEKIESSCYRAGWNGIKIINSYYVPGCEALWGPTARGRVFYRCTMGQ